MGLSKTPEHWRWTHRLARHCQNRCCHQEEGVPQESQYFGKFQACEGWQRSIASPRIGWVGPISLRCDVNDPTTYRSPMVVSIHISTTSSPFLKQRRSSKLHMSTSTSWAMAETLPLVPPPSMRRSSLILSRRRRLENSLPSLAGIMPWIVIRDGRGSRSPSRV